MADFCPHFVDEVCLLAWHRGFREGQRNLRCAKCQRIISIKYNGEYVPWGPSSDDDEAVVVEMRAAEIAAFCCIRDAWLACKVSDCERDGFDLDGNDEPSCPAEEVGYLARCIATHTDDEGGGR